MDNFKIIAITPEYPRADEIGWINLLLNHDTGVIDRVHLRHPGCDLRPILKKIPISLLSRITLHENPELLKEFEQVGFQFNRRTPYQRLAGSGLRSASCHSWDEVQTQSDLDYVTLSPVFDSISKTGYKGNRELLKTKAEVDVSVIALGGVSLSNLSLLRGFSGAAMLGELDRPLNEIPDFLQALKREIQKI